MKKINSSYGNPKGFTLLECMITVAIMFFILGAIFSYMMFFLKSDIFGQKENNENLDGRVLLAVITNELRYGYYKDEIEFKSGKRYEEITYFKDKEKTIEKTISKDNLPWSPNSNDYDVDSLYFTKSDNESYIIKIELTLKDKKDRKLFFETSILPLNQKL